MHPDIHCNIIQGSQDMQRTECLSTDYLDKEVAK